MLTQRWQNIETSNLSSGWQDNVGPTSAKSADHVTNSQRQSDGGMLSGREGVVNDTYAKEIYTTYFQVTQLIIY